MNLPENPDIFVQNLLRQPASNAREAFGHVANVCRFYDEYSAQFWTSARWFGVHKHFDHTFGELSTTYHAPSAFAKPEKHTSQLRKQNSINNICKRWTDEFYTVLYNQEIQLPSEPGQRFLEKLSQIARSYTAEQFVHAVRFCSQTAPGQTIFVTLAAITKACNYLPVQQLTAPRQQDTLSEHGSSFGGSDYNGGDLDDGELDDGDFDGGSDINNTSERPLHPNITVHRTKSSLSVELGRNRERALSNDTFGIPIEYSTESSLEDTLIFSLNRQDKRQDGLDARHNFETPTISIFSVPRFHLLPNKATSPTKMTPLLKGRGRRTTEDSVTAVLATAQGTVHDARSLYRKLRRQYKRATASLYQARALVNALEADISKLINTTSPPSMQQIENCFIESRTFINDCNNFFNTTIPSLPTSVRDGFGLHQLQLEHRHVELVKKYEGKITKLQEKREQLESARSDEKETSNQQAIDHQAYSNAKKTWEEIQRIANSSETELTDEDEHAC